MTRTSLTPLAATAALLLSAVISHAATSFSNSLTGFTGDTSQAGTQAALAAAGLEADSLDAGPAVTFGATGSTFGSGAAGDSGRNYLRTIQNDYATTSFEAFITIDAPRLDTPADDQASFFGLGRGQIALFGFPDWSTQFSSVVGLPEPGKLTTFRTQDDMNTFDDVAATIGNGTHRLKFAYNNVAMTATFSLDLDYAGGPFTADVTADPVDVSTLYSATGWPGEPSQIYFGGDDGVLFRDLVVTVIPEPTSLALLLVAATAIGSRRTKREL
jgi:hypothetical protein